MSLEVLLQNSPWMSGLNVAEQNKVRADIHIKKIPTEGYVCRRGQTADFWFGVISGVVKINNVAPSGKSTTLLGLAPGAWFGEGSLLKEESRRYDAVTLRDSELALMPRATDR